MYIKALLGLVLLFTPIVFSLKKSDQKREGKMVFGEVINITQAPYIVYIESSTRICAGTIVSRWNVITAAHCIISNNTRLISGSSRRVHHPKNVVKHPKFSVDSKNKTSAYDIAVIEVKEPFDYNNSTQPIKILKSREKINLMTGGEISGWGQNERGNIDNRLRKIDVTVENKNECYKKFADLGWHFNVDQICVKPKRRSQSACFGDSGSPLVVNKYFVGVNVYGGGCDGQWGTPSAITELSYHRKWIDNLVKYD